MRLKALMIDWAIGFLLMSFTMNIYAVIPEEEVALEENVAVTVEQVNEITERAITRLGGRELITEMLQTMRYDFKAAWQL